MDINLLVKLTAKAWTLGILAAMHRGTPGRQAALLTACPGAGRTAFGQSLSHLIALTLLERNPGHGHPLRPEFRLTQKGIEWAAISDRIKSATPRPEQDALLRRAWSVPILGVSQKPKQFTQIKTELNGITDRALSQSLKRLESQNWLCRTFDLEQRTPRPMYRAINQGQQVSVALNIGASP